MNIKKLLYRLYRYLPIKRKRVLFIGYYGAQYGCNPKYISEYLVDNYAAEAEVVWAFTEPQKHQVEGVCKVRFGSFAYLKMLATSRIVVTNYRMTSDFQKRNGQIYIQTWHSSLRLKKIEGDAEKSLPVHYVEMAKHDSAQTDYVVAGCRMSHDTFAKSFWYKGEILNIGTPRNDLLLCHNEQKRQVIKKTLLQDDAKKVVLYAPTFRKDKSTECYNLDFNRLRDVLAEKFGGEWMVMLRLHPHLINCELFKEEDGIINVTRYDDIQELLMISDVLVTDYSSLMFDFAISGKPVFLYAVDVVDYSKNDRSLYFDVKELPFSVAIDNDQIAENIHGFDSADYQDRIKLFNSKVGSYETGTAAAEISKLIIEKIRL